MGQFKKGASGNPRGRPRGIADQRVSLRALLVPHAKDLVDRVLTLAKSGDTAALRLCIERLIPVAREAPIQFDLPAIHQAEDCAAAQAAIVAAVAAGELLPGQARDLAALVDAHRAALESSELAQRIAALEAAQPAVQSPTRTHPEGI